MMIYDRPTGRMKRQKLTEKKKGANESDKGASGEHLRRARSNERSPQE